MFLTFVHPISALSLSLTCVYRSERHIDTIHEAGAHRDLDVLPTGIGAWICFIEGGREGSTASGDEVERHIYFFPVVMRLEQLDVNEASGHGGSIRSSSGQWSVLLGHSTLPHVLLMTVGVRPARWLATKRKATWNKWCLLATSSARR